MAKLSPTQKQGAKRSAEKHGRSKPGLWENVNASKGKGNKKQVSDRRPGRRP